MPVARPLDRIILIAVVVTVGLVAVTLVVVAVTGRGRAPVAAPPAPTGTTAAPVGDPDLVASDDFSGTGPDAKWGLYDSVSPIGATWTPAQDRVSDGTLRIVGSGSNPSGLGNRSGGMCWCGTGGNRTYGRWEVRARFDAGAGYGQTVGLWPQSDQAADGSITLAETREPDKHSLHTYVVWSDGQLRSHETVSNGDYTAWHTYSAEWRASFVRIMVDDRVVYDSTTSQSKVVIPRQPMHLYLQQTVGPHDGVPAADPSTPAEVDLSVDWVRVYR